MDKISGPRICTLEVEPMKLANELDLRSEEMDIRMSLRFLVWVTG